MTFAISSPAFAANQPIPKKFSREAGNVSPPLEWHSAPGGTQSFALIAEDPDAPNGTFRHWAAYDIPESCRQLTNGAGSRDQNPEVPMGRNDFGNARYDGPQPPLGHGVHHYHFRLFALDVPRLDVPPNSTAGDVLAAAQKHALGEADIVGTFTRESVEDAVADTPPAGDWNDVA